MSHLNINPYKLTNTTKYRKHYRENIPERIFSFQHHQKTMADTRSSKGSFIGIKDKRDSERTLKVNGVGKERI